ncbi:hypothetical protein KEM56_002181 [Ascosphaera pollenicola]|nr:hypothetical protein KEM56_002181 [Ascosphaera pollenicola]
MTGTNGCQTMIPSAQKVDRLPDSVQIKILTNYSISTTIIRLNNAWKKRIVAETWNDDSLRYPQGIVLKDSSIRYNFMEETIHLARVSAKKPKSPYPNIRDELFSQDAADEQHLKATSGAENALVEADRAIDTAQPSDAKAMDDKFESLINSVESLAAVVKKMVELRVTDPK